MLVLFYPGRILFFDPDSLYKRYRGWRQTGIVETTFFPETYHRFCHMIDRRRPYLLTGKVEGQQMFLDQKYTVEGDLSLLMQMDQLFGNN